jgi:predicted nucleotidyltransferase
MSVIGLALYGSCARRDDDEKSDVDILAITQDDQVATKTFNKTNLSYYPMDKILKLASKGDLFVLHINQEAKVLYDQCEIFEKINNIFEYKEHYQDEINRASELGWFLISIGSPNVNALILNRRVAWCVRTILIAKSAEARNPVFSAKSLRSFASSESVYYLIKNKDNHKFDKNVISIFSEFLMTFGHVACSKMTPNQWVHHFAATENKVAEKTVERIFRLSLGEGYI